MATTTLTMERTTMTTMAAMANRSSREQEINIAYCTLASKDLPSSNLLCACYQLLLLGFNLGVPQWRT